MPAEAPFSITFANPLISKLHNRLTVGPRVQAINSRSRFSEYQAENMNSVILIKVLYCYIGCYLSMLKFPWYEYEGVELNMISHDRKYLRKQTDVSNIARFVLNLICQKCVEALEIILRT